MKWSGIEKNGMGGKLGAIAMLTAVTVFLSGCGMGPKGGAEALLNVAPVRTEAVAKQSMGSPLEQVADVSSGVTLDIVPKASGEIVEVLAQRGQYVEKGTILFRIDSRDAESAVQKNDLALRNAEENLNKAREDQVNNRKDLVDAVEKAQIAFQNAERDYAKMRNDYDLGLVTEHQLDLSRQQVDLTRMAWESAQNKLAAHDNSNTISSYETQLETARLALEDSVRSLEEHSVKAPGNGFLIDFAPEVGQTINAGSIVGQVQKVDPIKIEAELSETNYGYVKNKEELAFYSPDKPDFRGTAKISYLDPIMSATSKMYSLELEIPNPDHTIQPGSRVMIQLTTEAEQMVPAVPILSIIREDSDAFVFVLRGDVYEKRKVRLGRINGLYQEVVDGVKEGEQVVVSGHHQLKDGQKVEAQPATGTSDAATSTVDGNEGK